MPDQHDRTIQWCSCNRTQQYACTLQLRIARAPYVDLGDKVRKGQLLGLISAPDLDAMVSQQASLVQQSSAGVESAQAAVHLQQATYNRVHTLVLHGILSQAGR